VVDSAQLTLANC